MIKEGLASKFRISIWSAGILITADWVLFGGEVFTAGVGLPFTMPIGFFVGFLVAMFQRYDTGDNWGVAFSKGVTLGILTAIPTPLPTILVGVAGRYNSSFFPMK